jgi:putative addiction module component (TIGR02574 family)
MSYEDVKREALRLAGDEQLELAYTLIRNAGADEDEEHEIDRLWVEEMERRYQDYLDGKVEAVPGEEAIRRIRAALR